MGGCRSCYGAKSETSIALPPQELEEGLRSGPYLLLYISYGVGLIHSGSLEVPRREEHIIEAVQTLTRPFFRERHRKIPGFRSVQGPQTYHTEILHRLVYQLSLFQFRAAVFAVHCTMHCVL